MQVIVEGRNLERLIHHGLTPDLDRLSEGLFESLEWVSVRKRWFEDISEKNVIQTTDGRFGIADGAATLPCSVLPETAIYANKEYWMPVFSYLIGRVRLSDLRPDELPGILFNYLQAMFILLRVRLVYIDQEGYYTSASLFDQLPMILDKLVPEFRGLFTRLLIREDKTPGLEDLEKIKTLFMKRVIGRGEDLVARPAPELELMPVIGLFARPVGLAARPMETRAGMRTTMWQNGDLLVAMILAVALSFSVWLSAGR